ncbi:TIGR04028 family ABC transporter substrate-binding protein [Corynebacterium sp.]|uniref:TIGR04028 family ABC transporter substrate-binding protein n=1 Tax=Corynebacterium sp. TaxID=1720 RepID=UPI0025C35D60|nr:TIGR04028 family ABC transporter substrate-binding protein [Corynebacterium sp.]
MTFPFPPASRAALPGRRALVAVVAAVTAAVVTVGLTACASTDGGRRDAGARELVYLESLPYNSLYPPAAGFYPNGGILNNITDRLLWQDPETLELHPWIATDLPEINDDATEFTFTIRDGVTYSDGTPLTPDNVVRNFDLYALGDPDRGLSSSEQISTYERGEVLDDHTVRFHFSDPEPGFPQATSSFNAGLLADASLGQSDEGFSPGNAAKVIGSGPFVVSAEQLNTEVTLDAREDYDWAPQGVGQQGAPKIDRVSVVVNQEDSVRVGGLKSAQGDVARQIEAPEERHLTDDGVGVLSAPTNGVNNQIAFRFRHPLLSDIRVRQAIIAGVNRNRILNSLFSDSYTRASSSLASTAAGYREQKDAYVFDPDRARRLLDDAGWIPGDDGIRVKDGERLSLTANDSEQQPRAREVVTMVQEQLRDIGVEVNLYPGDVAAQKAAQVDQDLIQLNVTMVGRADYDVIKSQYYSQNRNQLLNYDTEDESVGDPELEELLLRVSGSVDEEARAAASGDVQDYLTEQAYVLPFFEEPQVYGVQDYVQGFTTDPIGRPWFYPVALDRNDEG